MIYYAKLEKASRKIQSKILLTYIRKSVNQLISAVCAYSWVSPLELWITTGVTAKSLCSAGATFRLSCNAVT